MITSAYFICLELHSVYDPSKFGVQIIKSVIFLLHFCLPDPNQGIETSWNNDFTTFGFVLNYRLPQ